MAFPVLTGINLGGIARLTVLLPPALPQPNVLPVPITAYDYFRKWRQAGVWQRINDALREPVRKKAGRKKTPRTAALDSQSAKAGGSSGEVGDDAGKKIAGRKRHLLVDSLGLLLAVLGTVTAAADTRAAADLMAALPLD